MLSWEEVPTNSEGAETPPRRAPCPRGSRRWGSVQKCWECVRGVPGALAPPNPMLGVWPSVTSLGTSRASGSKVKAGPRSRSVATSLPQWRTGGLRPDPKKLPGHPAARHGRALGITLPATSGRCTGGSWALCIWRPLLGSSLRDMAASNIQSLPFGCQSREVPHPNPRPGPEGVDDHPEGGRQRTHFP